jgi:hypothetical protein
MAKFCAFTRSIEIASSFHNGNITWAVERVQRLPVARRKAVAVLMREWLKNDAGEWERFERAYRQVAPRTQLIEPS